MTETEEPSLFDDLPVKAEVVDLSRPEPSSPVRPDGLTEETFGRLKGIEDKLLEKANAIVDGVMAFSDLDPEAEGPPKEWVDALGIPEAVKRFRLAKAGQLSSSAAPVGIKVAMGVHATITKSRAMEKSGPKVLNVQLVKMSAPLPEFPRRIVEVNNK